jgi:putative nucleotidyltransferase with HDIG domain
MASSALLRTYRATPAAPIAARSMNVRRLKAWAEEAAARPEHEQSMVARATELLSLAAALNAHDRRTRGHSERVRVLTALVAEEMQLDEEEAARLQWGALLHDIGKLTVPASILNKPGAPDEQEWRVLQRHPVEGARLAEPLHEWLGDWMAAISEHHEWYDGGGYPRGLTGAEISLAGRVVSVTDSFDTMTSLRSYNRPVSVVEAREELVRCSGKQFDPAVVRAFLEISLRRLHWAVGLFALVAQIPIARALARILSGPRVGEPAGAGAAFAAVTTLVLTLGFTVPPIAGAGVVSSAGVGGDPDAGSTQLRGAISPAVFEARAGAADQSAVNASNAPAGPPFVPPGWTKPHPPGPANDDPPGRDPLPVPTWVPGSGSPGGSAQ